jgi:hypothetical protein
MKVLEPNIGKKEIEYILKDSIYVAIADYGSIKILKELILGPGEHLWHWIDIGSSTNNLYPFDRHASFDILINKAINDIFWTVYEFADIKDFLNNINDIKYIDSPRTIYKIKDEEN